jgi:hypothetical protein
MTNRIGNSVKEVLKETFEYYAKEYIYYIESKNTKWESETKAYALGCAKMVLGNQEMLYACTGVNNLKSITTYKKMIRDFMNEGKGTEEIIETVTKQYLENFK